MVVFTCNHCGESLQKPRVEKHYSFVCRRPKSLTCVDCFKDFRDEEYVVHTKCITEEERYSAKGSIPGGIVKKGDKKQGSWTEMIGSIVETEKNLKPSLRNLFNTISSYTNVPRKKVKFMNFLKNSLGGRVNLNDVEAAWELIEKFKNNNPNESATEPESNKEKQSEAVEDGSDIPKTRKNKKKKKLENGNNEEEITVEKGTETAQNGNHEQQNGNNLPKIKKNKKKKLDSGKNEEELTEKKIKLDKGTENTEEKSEVGENGNHEQQNGNDIPKTKKNKKKKKHENGNSEEEPIIEKKIKLDEAGTKTEETDKFSFKNTILKTLKAKGKISSKKLQKKVLNTYLKETGNEEYTDKTIKKYNKKLKKIANVSINDDIVMLLSPES